MSCLAGLLRHANMARLRQTFLLTAVFTALCTMLSITRLRQSSCSYNSTVQVVRNLCSLYSRGQFGGPLCHRVCEERVFTFDFCGQDAMSNKHVLIMGCDNCGLGDDVSKVVMKVNYNDTKLNNTTNVIFKDFNEIGVDLAVTRTERFIRRQVVLHLGMNASSIPDTLSRLLGSDFNTWRVNSSPQAIETILRTLVALSLQPEYVKLSFLGPGPFLPKLYGFCGPAFFVENTPSLTQRGYIIPFLKSVPSEVLSWNFKLVPWPQRAEAALDILSKLRALETSSGPTLHVCDLEVRNTGVSDSNGVVFLDIDKARYDMGYAGLNCSHDSHCTLETCHGRCNLEQRMCAPERLNNNIQVACKKLLVGHYGGVLGLLRFPPASINSELTRLLDQCSNPVDYTGNRHPRPHAASLDVVEKIGVLLLRSLEGS